MRATLWNWSQRGAGLACVLAALAACGNTRPPDDAPAVDVSSRDADADASAPALPSWPCPAGWVLAATGGCGPAVVLCAPDGGAAPGACDALDVSHLHPVPGPDGGGDGGLGGFVLAADGAVNGAWPARDFTPDAGIPTCDGWMRTPDGLCDPRLRTDCPEGSAALPNQLCTTTAESDCPVADWPDVSAEHGSAPVRYVRSGADPGLADGSMAAPFATLGAALAASMSDTETWVLLAAGTYTESVLLARGKVHVVGVCAARVVIRGGDAASGAATIAVRGSGVRLELRGLTVAQGRNGVAATAGAQLVATHARVEDAAGYGLFVEDATTTASLRDVFVRRVQPASGVVRRAALHVAASATLSAAGLAVDAPGEVGVEADTLFDVTLTDGVLRGARPSPVRIGDTGTGIWVGGASATQATLLAQRMVIDDNAGYGVWTNAASTTTVRDSVVSGSGRPDSTSMNVAGVVATTGAQVTVERTQVSGASVTGMLATGPGARITVRDSVVQDVVVGTRGIVGAGLSAINRGTVTAERVLVARAVSAGVVAGGATVNLTDSIVRETRYNLDRNGGGGLRALLAGSVTAQRVRIEGNQGTGVSCAGMTTQMHLTDSLVLDSNTPPESRDYGVGVAVSRGCVVDLTRVRVERARMVGLLVVYPDSTATLRDVLVRDIQPLRDGTTGRGLHAEGGGTLDAARVLVEQVREVGVNAFGGDAHATLDDVIVRHVAPGPRGFGMGATAMAGGALQASRLALLDVNGGALVAIPDDPASPSRLNALDVMVAGVGASTVALTGTPPQPTGRAVAYGFHTRDGSQFTVRQFVASQGGFGFYNTAGSMRLEHGIVRAMSEAFGAVNGATGDDDVRVDVVSVGNPPPGDVLRDLELPGSTALPLPPELCPMSGCN